MRAPFVVQNLPTRCGGFAGRQVRQAGRSLRGALLPQATRDGVTAGRSCLPQAMRNGENRCAQQIDGGANLVGAAFRQPRAIPYSQFKTESMASRNACTSSAVV